MIKELEEDREESQDPEIEFAIAGAVREYGGLEILLDMIKVRLLYHKRKCGFSAHCSVITHWVDLIVLVQLWIHGRGAQNKYSVYEKSGFRRYMLSINPKKLVELANLIYIADFAEFTR